MERFFIVFLHQVRPNGIVTRLETGPTEIIGVDSGREPVALCAGKEAGRRRNEILISFLGRGFKRFAGLTEYAAHLIFWFAAGTQNSVNGPLLTLYITFISCWPRGTCIMNLQKVYELSNDASSTQPR